MFFIVKNHWQPYFTDNPRMMRQIPQGSLKASSYSTNQIPEF
jgi:hypothetical protein